jgi:hypothetical protein
MKKVSKIERITFLGTTTKLQLTNICFVMSIRLSARQKGKSRLVLEGFWRNFILRAYWNLSGICFFIWQKTLLRAGRFEVRKPKGATYFSFSLISQTDSGADLPSYPLNGYRGSFSGQSGQGVMLTTHLHIALRLRMSGAISLLPPYDSWHGEGQLKLGHMEALSTSFVRKVLRLI